MIENIRLRMIFKELDWIFTCLISTGAIITIVTLFFGLYLAALYFHITDAIPDFRRYRITKWFGKPVWL